MSVPANVQCLEDDLMSFDEMMERLERMFVELKSLHHQIADDPELTAEVCQIAAGITAAAGKIVTTVSTLVQ